MGYYCATEQQWNFLSIWTYTTMMLPRVRNHHGGNRVRGVVFRGEVVYSTSLSMVCVKYSAYEELLLISRMSGNDEKIPYTISGTKKGVVYLNQHNFRSLMKLNEVHKFCDGTLMKICDNLIEMVNNNELGRGNNRLKGRDWNDKDIKRTNEMLDKIDQTMKRREQLRRFEEYVEGRPKTIDPHFYVWP
ncbi:hypothetical protein Tco_1076501 [Tanacetum coccineum]